MTRDHKTMANDGYTFQKGWTPKSASEKPTIGSGGAKPPSGGSAVKPANNSPKR